MVNKRKDSRNKADCIVYVAQYRSTENPNIKWAVVYEDGQGGIIRWRACETKDEAYEIMEEFIQCLQ